MAGRIQKEPNIQIIDRGQRGTLELADKVKVKIGKKTQTMSIQDFVSSPLYAEFGNAMQRFDRITAYSKKYYLIHESLAQTILLLTPKAASREPSPRIELGGLGISVSQPEHMGVPSWRTDYIPLAGNALPSNYSPRERTDNNQYLGVWISLSLGWGDPAEQATPPPAQAPTHPSNPPRRTTK